ncbi:hypothetical protein KDW_29730 [Dictyobacter vulcani]|uniref:Uncharacterized protein n=1 Tax=Dictyobacter vulcani TaxID=2607529 RepID=A0A5J4KQY2_9CHLR|nr:hypothetical protein [Dictyobacter vulcani]GER88811.1 hypothetical protein KDW_29730 [Dictyobacter vulcani]
MAKIYQGSLAETLKANPYEYADDNPVNNVDPGGNISIAGACIAAALAAVALGAVTLSVTLFTGGADIPAIIAALGLWGSGELAIAGVTIDGAVLIGCLGGIATEAFTEASSSM